MNEAQTYKQRRAEQLEVLALLCDDLIGKRLRPTDGGDPYMPDTDTVRQLLKRIEKTLNRAAGREK